MERLSRRKGRPGTRRGGAPWSRRPAPGPARKSLLGAEAPLWLRVLAAVSLPPYGVRGLVARPRRDRDGCRLGGLRANVQLPLVLARPAAESKGGGAVPARDGLTAEHGLALDGGHAAHVRREIVATHLCTMGGRRVARLGTFCSSRKLGPTTKRLRDATQDARGPGETNGQLKLGAYGACDGSSWKFVRPKYVTSHKPASQNRMSTRTRPSHVCAEPGRWAQVHPLSTLGTRAHDARAPSALSPMSIVHHNHETPKRQYHQLHTHGCLHTPTHA